MEIEQYPDKSEEVMDWASPTDNLCTKEFQADGEQGKTYVSVFKGEFELQQKGGDKSDQSQLFNYPMLAN